MTQMNLFTGWDFERLYGNLRSEDGLMAVLTQMQESYGIHERKACENADTMIRLVAAHENAVKVMSDDSMEVLNAFLAQSAELPDYDRKAMLQHLHFTLKLYQDEAQLDKIKNGAREGDLFYEYKAACDNNPSITEATLEADIRELIGSYRISPGAMRYIVSDLERGESFVASAAALGENGMRFKAVVAMDLYLRNQDTMTMEEAVNTACTHVELQAVADAVSHGQLAEKRANELIIIIALAFVLYAFAHYLLVGCGAVAATAWVTPLFIGVGLGVISDVAAKWIGQITAHGSFFRAAKEASAKAAMEQMINRMETEIKDITDIQIVEVEEENPLPQSAKLNTQ